jgi:hypothetical protein
MDSLLEGDGFELVVPRHESSGFRHTQVDHSHHKIVAGTDGSRTIWPLEQAGFATSVPSEQRRAISSAVAS